MKRSLYFLAITFFALSSALAGCRGKDDSSQESKSTKNNSFILRVGNWDTDQSQFKKDYWKGIEDAFKQRYPNAVIQWEIVPSAAYFSKLQIQLASGTAPDVFESDIGLVPDYVAADYIGELSNEPWVPRLVPSALERGSTEGKLYSVARAQNATGVWYNKTMFDELGLSVPKTWDEMLAVCKKLKEARKVPIVLSFKDGWTTGIFVDNIIQSIGYAQVPSFGRKLYDGEIKLNGPIMTDIMRKIEYMSEIGYFNKTALSLTYPESLQVFVRGEAGLIFQGSWMHAEAQKIMESEGSKPFEIGYFSVPPINGQPVLIHDISNGYFINKSSKHAREAKELLEIMLRPELLGPVLSGDGSTPLLSGVETDYAFPALRQLQQELASYPVQFPVKNYIGEIIIPIRNEVTRIVSGEKFNPASLDESQSLLEKSKADGLINAPLK